MIGKRLSSLPSSQSLHFAVLCETWLVEKPFLSSLSLLQCSLKTSYVHLYKEFRVKGTYFPPQFATIRHNIFSILLFYFIDAFRMPFCMLLIA
jgi:hypothetical protein